MAPFVIQKLGGYGLRPLEHVPKKLIDFFDQNMPWSDFFPIRSFDLIGKRSKVHPFHCH
jgi:hypothetical protein